MYANFTQVDITEEHKEILDRYKDRIAKRNEL